MAQADKFLNISEKRSDQFIAWLGCLVVSIVCGYFFTSLVIDYAENNERNHLLEKTILASRSIDLEKVKRLNG